MAPATELLDELIEEIFLRIHPADGTTLTRAALVCRRWCRLIADPGFRRRFHEFHRAPHMLGYSCNAYEDFEGRWSYRPPSGVACFVRTSSSLKSVDMERSCVMDTRHGRVLLFRAPADRGSCYLFVWDPITKEKRALPWPPLPDKYAETWNAAVLCAAAGCDHLDCHGKPFTVVYIATENRTVMSSSVYSSKVGRWTETRLLAQQPENSLELVPSPSALVGNALYFRLRTKTGILKYNVSAREIHTIHLPPDCVLGRRRIVLMATEDGCLGFATMRDSKLCMWSSHGDSDKDVGWTPRKVIDLEALLPIRALENPADVVGFTDGLGFIFVKTNCGHFRIDTESNRVRKIRPGSTIFPYMSFHAPALRAAAAYTGRDQAAWVLKVLICGLLGQVEIGLWRRLASMSALQWTIV